MQNTTIYRLKRQHIGVTVKQRKPSQKSYTVCAIDDAPSVAIVKPDTLLCELEPDSIKSADNETIPPSGKYFITAETHYPFHLVLDIMDMTAVQYVSTR